MTPDQDTTPSGERLQKLLARAGSATSRRKAEELIRAGRVTVNGIPATLGMRVAEGSDVCLDGTTVTTATPGTLLLLNKPQGVVTTRHDPQGRRTVFDLVPHRAGLHTVGRLDMNSEGLLLLTDDGALTQRLTHPSFQHGKRYRVWCEGGALDDAACRTLERGVTLDDGPARADRARSQPGGCTIDLHEGRKRQVRRMLAAIHRPVTRLVRTHVAGIALGQLPSGHWRHATPEERAGLGYAS